MEEEPYLYISIIGYTREELDILTTTELFVIENVYKFSHTRKEVCEMLNISYAEECEIEISALHRLEETYEKEKNNSTIYELVEM